MIWGFEPLGDVSNPGSGKGVGVFMQDTQGRFLLHLRDDRADIPWGGLWSVFGGGVEDGETLNFAARREMGEEIGIALDAEDLVPFRCVCSTSPNRPMFFLLECKRLIEPAEIRLGEGAGFAFFTPAQALAIDFVPFMRPALTLFVEQRRNGFHGA